jgi:Mg-chelatase subunit ChlD
MTFLSPIWLFLLIPLAVALVIWRPPTMFLLVIRLMSIVCVVLALAGWAISLPSRAGTVVVIADRSLSMPVEAATAQKTAIDIIYGQMSSSDQLAVVSFGQRAVIEQEPSHKKFEGFQQNPGGNASSLGEALELALSLIPAGAPGRVIVLSDGKWTGRDPVPLASTALTRNVSIDFRSYDRSTTGDLAISRIDAPTVVASGESYIVTAWVWSPTPETVSFDLKRGEQVISSGTRDLISGMNRLTFRDRAGPIGNQGYLLSVHPLDKEGKRKESDPVPENNTAKFLVGINGPRPILHVSEKAGSGFANLLAAGKLNVRSIRPNEARWDLEDLSRYSSVILENVPADKVGHVGMETLANWVKVTGAGLMMTGGQSSYGPGGYHKSPIEDIMPVTMELRQEHRKLSLAIVVALDRSGSMAVPVAGGKVKMDLANMGTAAVLDMLGPQDEFGCLAVDTIPHTISPLDRVTDKDGTRRKILGIQSMGGGIFVYEALAAASNMLMKAKAGTKHIILFSDANDSEEPGKYQELLANCRKAGITVSVIGLGTDKDVDAELLKDVAKRGGGRISFTDKPEELPRLFAQDTFVVARNTFLTDPVKIRHTAQLSTLIDRELPSPGTLALGGYNLCYLREKATMGTVTMDEYKAPVAASWRVGAGRVTAYTGEADGKFAGAMAKYDRVGDYFTSLARWTAGAPNPLRDNMLLTQEVREGMNVITLHLDPERKGESFTGLPEVTTLRSSPGETPAPVKAKMSWTGPDTLSMELPLENNATSLSTIEVPGHDPVALPPVCIPYSPEFKPTQGERGQATLERLAKVTGGQERIEVGSIWNDLPRQVRMIPLAIGLLLGAVVLWLVEVLQRRTGLFSDFFRRTPKRIEEDDATEVAVAGRITGRPATLQNPEKYAETKPEEPEVEEGPQSIPTSVPAEDAGGLVAALRQARKKSGR